MPQTAAVRPAPARKRKKKKKAAMAADKLPAAA